MHIKIELLTSFLLTFFAVATGNGVVTTLGAVATVWGILNQFYTNKKRVDRHFAGSWKMYLKYLVKFKIKK